MPEAAFHALTDQLKKAGQDRAHDARENATKRTLYRVDPAEEGRRLAQESASAFREAIKVKRENNP